MEEKQPPPERGARKGSADSIDDVFMELKLTGADISSSSDEEAGMFFLAAFLSTLLMLND